MRWRLLALGDAEAGGSEGSPGPFNMGLDEALLASAVATGTPSLRFYTWAGPWLSVGYAQSFDESRLPALDAAGVGFVRRVTGGKAVLHGADLTYAVAAPDGVLPDGVRDAELIKLLAGWRVNLASIAQEGEPVSVDAVA